MSPLDHEVPPVGEEIHLPGPSMVPIVNAFGISLALVGLLLNLGFTVVGVLIFAFSLARWIGDTRRGIAELPMEHH